ncbi:hypothetical protein HMJ29_08290 [Hymenobacter taeanensis]|uniref:CBM-cenC domain-containing protein n=1 Tax=Hymenobacter taeanensis TaxID=2735321 RepID=A0A6M6BED6_9BACT|nr:MULTISPECIES: hypothetical protein [Hymenobacter]QJX46931.1 hypothetical protein HMJ29_08290 [Hymenobacter taeanensis]UOQ80808.1 hypothetical protein MUN83_18645 [Hymenobacter sp. 5414T-23]
MKKLLFVTALAGLAACSSDGTSSYQRLSGPNVLTDTSFEEVYGWGIDPATLTRERAHSGMYSMRVDPAHEYSMTYSVVIGQMSPRKVKKIKLSAWVFLPSENTKAILGVQIVDPDQGYKEVFGDGVKMETVKEYNKWVQVEKVMELPETLAPTHNLKLFLWRAAAVDPVYVDDVRLTIEE